MNFSSLEYFTVLARERQFTKAARLLHITQQSLSAHISALEEELGCPLVIRRVPLQLTYGGETFLRYAEHILEELNCMKREFCDISANQRGILRIGIAFTRSHILMPELISAFHRQYPHIEIQLIEDTNEALLQHLQNGEIDIAIANIEHAYGDVRIYDFYQDSIVLLVPKSLLGSIFRDSSDILTAQLQNGDISGLANCPFVLGKTDDIVGKQEQLMFARAKFTPDIKVRSENIETLLGLCRRGEAACFCPMRFVKSLLTDEDMTNINVYSLGKQAVYNICFGVLDSDYQWSIIPEFIRIAKETALITAD